MQKMKQNIFLDCGMEGGSVLFRALVSLWRGHNLWWIDSGKIEQNAGIELPLAQYFDQQHNYFDDGEQSMIFVYRVKLGKNLVVS